MELPMTLTYCANCGMPFAITKDLYDRLKVCHNAFFCPKGHSNYFPAKSDVEILKGKILSKDLEIIELKKALEKKTRKPKKVAVK